MNCSVSASVGLACLLLAGPAAAAEPITDPAAPLVRQLELRFAGSLAAARSGDLDAYWGYRTTAARSRPPSLDSTRLKLLAELLPPLETLRFVRLDSSGKMARALYRWRKSDVAQYTVIVYRMEQGEWKIDDFNVRRSGMAAPQAQRSTEMLPRQRSEAPTVPAPSLEAPRL